MTGSSVEGAGRCRILLSWANIGEVSPIACTVFMIGTQTPGAASAKNTSHPNIVVMAIVISAGGDGTNGTTTILNGIGRCAKK
jgi:hypothetical protein